MVVSRKSCSASVFVLCTNQSSSRGTFHSVSFRKKVSFDADLNLCTSGTLSTPHFYDCHKNATATKVWFGLASPTHVRQSRREHVLSTVSSCVNTYALSVPQKAQSCSLSKMRWAVGMLGVFQNNWPDSRQKPDCGFFHGSSWSSDFSLSL